MRITALGIVALLKPFAGLPPAIGSASRVEGPSPMTIRAEPEPALALPALATPWWSTSGGHGTNQQLGELAKQFDANKWAAELGKRSVASCSTTAGIWYGRTR